MKKTTVKERKPIYEKPVKRGDQGAIVSYICELLQKKGSTVKITDKFHIGVSSAVTSFQKKNKLKPTGVVDKKTWDKLTK